MVFLQTYESGYAEELSDKTGGSACSSQTNPPPFLILEAKRKHERKKLNTRGEICYYMKN